ncbi:calcium-binding protein [Rubellimicrobium arenae]|uniref:calcium-binding protein n=1 Tax=Rubellimicrobium arenae TaxID=2817372 RepID=UPI001B300416|nr:calcium-binding protein [Rubellimicrobium arenae]
MATLDFSQSKHWFSMTDPQFVGFRTALTIQPDLWQFITPGGHTVTLHGSGLTYDASGRAKTGTVTSISFDLGNNGSPDVTITGISAPAALLDNGPTDFWRFLEGNDVLLGPAVAQGALDATIYMVGDGGAARPGRQAGGSDVIHTGDGRVVAYGDVETVGSPVAGTRTSDYRGGNDEILSLETAKFRHLTGDAGSVHAGSKLTGGHDTILIRATLPSYAVGDALSVGGAGGTLTQVVGGNDQITAGLNFNGKLVGDVHDQYADSLVRGGADTIRGGELGEVIIGDVYRLASGRLIGGNDAIEGNGGNDTIYGDSYFADGYSTITGGHDVIDAGSGDDEVHGDYGNGGNGNVGGDDRLTGGNGNDRLDGDAGNDVLYGGSGLDGLVGDEGDDVLYAGTQSDYLYAGSGNDMLDGGAGADDMRGGAGDDTYLVDDFGDKVMEGANAGTDTVWSAMSGYTLGGNVEDLIFYGLGGFTGVGNSLGNTISGGALADRLHGEGGNDTLLGGAGADLLAGGAGIDTVSYASATTGGVDARLTGNSIYFGGDALGDVYVGVENLTGSDFRDNLHGDNGANTLAGGLEQDNLYGYGGADTLIGGGGADTLLGGEGNDIFVFTARNEGRDTVVDFNRLVGNDDRLVFEGDAFGGLAEGALAAGRFVANTSGLATTSNQRFVYETDTGVLRFDANGSAAGGVTELAVFSGGAVITAADVLIV